MKRGPGLAVRLALRLCLAGLLIFGFVAGFIIMRTAAAREAALTTALTARADALQTLVTVTESGEAEMEFDDEITRDYGGRHPFAFFQLARPDGGLLEQTDFAEAAGLGSPDPRLILTDQAWEIRLDGRRFHCRGRALFPSATTGENRGENRAGGDPEGNRETGIIDRGAGDPAARPSVLLVVGVDRTELDRQFAATTGFTLAGTGLGLLLLCLLAWVLVRHALQPLAALRRELAGFSEHRLAPIVLEAPEEIAAVITTLNTLTARLAGAFARERAFTADAAHELRTPIAELRTLAEVTLRRPGRDAAARRELETVLATTLRMQELVEKLLLLARADDGAMPLAPEPVAVAPLVSALIAARVEPAAARRVRFAAAVPAGLTLITDAALFRQILDNLIGNAAAHADEGSAVEVAATSDPEQFTLRLTNLARGLDRDAVAQLFDRFWRRDPARRAGSTHHGLGLAVARSLAAVLGGELTAELAEPDRLAVILTLPSVSPAGSASPRTNS